MQFFNHCIFIGLIFSGMNTEFVITYFKTNMSVLGIPISMLIVESASQHHQITSHDSEWNEMNLQNALGLLMH